MFANETIYAWGTMQNGRLQRGMYSRSDSAATPEIAYELAKPEKSDCDAYALLAITVAPHADGSGDFRLVRETILNIVPRA